MRLKLMLYLRLRTLFVSRHVEGELDEELRYHSEREVEKHISAGMPAKNARYAALKAMGATEQWKEECRDARGFRWLQDMLLDVKYAVRSLRNTPSFTLIAALVLTLAIGANTAVFTVVNSVLLRPLPFPDSDRLVLISKVPKELFFPLGPTMVDRDYLGFREHNRSFENVASVGWFGRQGRKMTLTRRGRPTILAASVVGIDFLRVLKVAPFIGSDFQIDGQPQKAVLLSHGLWTRRFGGRGKAIGQDIVLDGVSYTIVGVMPASFTFQNVDLLMKDKTQLDPNTVSSVAVIGRLKAGVSNQQAYTELRTFADQAVRDGGFNGKDSVVRILPMRDLFVAPVRRLLLIFMGAVGFVFLIACSNFANLLLIRSSGREPELAVRAALGASRWRIVRQLITESTLLSAFGATLGVLLSFVGVPSLIAILPADDIPPAMHLNPDKWVLLFAFLLAIVTGACFGLIPALRITRRTLRQGTSEGGRNSLGRRESFRSGLVVVELASALILLSAAGLLVKSFLQMRAVDPGFRATNLLVTSVSLPEARYRTVAQMHLFNQRVLTGLQKLPGVKSSAAVSFLPFGHGMTGDFHLGDGRPWPQGYTVDQPEISAGYFRTMGIRLLSGREFNERDGAASTGVAVISDSVARRLWPSGDGIGKRISMENHPEAEDWLTIVGVVADVRQQGLSDRAAPVIYQPCQQSKVARFISGISFVVRSERHTAASAGMRAVIQDVDKELPVESVRTMNSIVTDSMAGIRSQTRLLTSFSILALLLAAMGVYGVLACSVVERTHEIGIRMAVGAGQISLVWMVLRRTLTLTAGGAIVGIAASLALTRVLTRLLFEVKPTDSGTLFVATAILIAVGLLSSFLPARRAATVEPVEALRHS